MLVQQTYIPGNFEQGTANAASTSPCDAASFADNLTDLSAWANNSRRMSFATILLSSPAAHHLPQSWGALQGSQS